MDYRTPRDLKLNLDGTSPPSTHCERDEASALDRAHLYPFGLVHVNEPEGLGNDKDVRRQNIDTSRTPSAEYTFVQAFTFPFPVMRATDRLSNQ